MMCAGVQKVSRPIDMCHEMSHGPPIVPHTTPATMHQIVHGTDSTFAVVPAPTRADMGGLAICCPKGIDCPIACHSFAATTCGLAASLHPAALSANILPTLQRRQLLSNYACPPILFPYP